MKCSRERTHLLVFLLLLGAAVTTASCEMPFGLFSDDTSEGPHDLVGIVWRLQATSSLDRTKIYTPPEDQIYAFRLMEDGKVQAQEACNACGGSYEVISDDSLSIGFGCTEKGCALHTFHGFSAAIAHVKTYEVQGHALRLSTDGDIPAVYAGEEHEVLYFQAIDCHEKISFCQ